MEQIDLSLPEKHYDVIVIGSGVGGYNAAIRAGQLGLSVACVEKERMLGGTCLNIGCMPSKSLLHASEMFELAGSEFASLGIIVSPQLDLTTMMLQKQETVASLVRGVEYLLKKNKVDRVDGHAHFIDHGRLMIVAIDGSKRELCAPNIVIATGSSPSLLPGVQIDQKRIVDSEGALSLTEVPRRLIVIGGGVIGLELGSVWRRLGAAVQVIEVQDQLLPGADGEITKAFRRILEKQGMTFQVSTKVLSSRIEQDIVQLEITPVKGGATEYVEADVVLVATGRRPHTGNLGLGKVGLSPDARGFIPTQRHRTRVSGIWAIGDVTHGPMLAHKAEEEAVACIELIANQAGHVDYEAIPSVVYTSPEIAWVGKTEEQVRTEGIGFKVGKFPFSANGRARINHEKLGFVKVISGADDFRILGVHMIGPVASEMIGEACLAMQFRADSEDVARTCHPHPTRSEAFRQASMAVDGWATQI
jgi:dihydrolipoamide dehydrogenase